MTYLRSQAMEAVSNLGMEAGYKIAIVPLNNNTDKQD